MTLVDRYLRAVRDHLPRAEQDDIINELSDNLHSRIEDEEAARGRPLEENEEVGHPEGVRPSDGRRGALSRRRAVGDVRPAARSGPSSSRPTRRSWPSTWPITVLIAAIALVAGSGIWSGFAGILVPLAIQFIIVTAIFVFIDRRWIRDPDGWDPRTVNCDGARRRRLDPRRHRRSAARQGTYPRGRRGDVRPGDRRDRRRADRGAEFGIPERIGFMTPGPGWRDVFVPGIAILVFAFVTPIVNLFRPRWTQFRVASHAAVDIAVIVLGIVSLMLGDWVVLAGPGTADRRSGEPHQRHQHHRAHLDRGDGRPDRGHGGPRGPAAPPDAARTRAPGRGPDQLADESV